MVGGRSPRRARIRSMMAWMVSSSAFPDPQKQSQISIGLKEITNNTANPIQTGMSKQIKKNVLYLFGTDLLYWVGFGQSLRQIAVLYVYRFCLSICSANMCVEYWSSEAQLKDMEAYGCIQMRDGRTWMHTDAYGCIWMHTDAYGGQQIRILLRQTDIL